VLFPKYEAKALLQLPEPPRQGEQRNNNNAIELPVFKRVAAAYASPAELRAYLDAKRLRQSPAAARLLTLAERPGFWDHAVRPVLPFTRRDQKEFGDIKDAAANFLIGVELTAAGRSEELTSQMVGTLAGYLVNALIREKVRGWVIAGKAESLGTAKTLQADIVRAQLDIELLERRAQDMKAILSKYPDSARMEARQVVSVNPSEGGERFLSPLAQLVGFESAISQRRELIRRSEREIRQKELLAVFFDGAERAVEADVTIETLMPALRQLEVKTFAAVDLAQEWAQEAKFRIAGALDSFAVMPSQYGVRGSVLVSEMQSRTPGYLAFMLGLLGMVIIIGIAVVTAGVRATGLSGTS
jgi:hypothetical protein